MSRAGYVPCRGGCGVREHRLGTAAAANYGRGGGRRARRTGAPSYAPTARSSVDTALDLVAAFVGGWRRLQAWWGRSSAPTQLPPAPTPAELHARRRVYRQRIKKQQPRLRGAELEARTDALMQRDLHDLNRKRAAWHRWHAPAHMPAPTPVVDPSMRARRPPPSRPGM